jgi:hypothetical protein
LATDTKHRPIEKALIAVLQQGSVTRARSGCTLFRDGVLNLAQLALQYLILRVDILCVLLDGPQDVLRLFDPVVCNEPS